MLFMNDMDITDALYRYDRYNTPNLYEAAQILARLSAWTNRNSDGWAYWPKPVRAAKSLITLIQAADRWDPTDCTEAELRKACTPIRSFLTRQGVDHSVVFP